MDFITTKSIAIIGFGPFSQFFVPHLKPFFENISVWNRSDKQAIAQEMGVSSVTLVEALSKDIIVLSTSVSFFEDLLKIHQIDINPNALVLDVASVKLKPVEILEKYLPKSCQIVATHPLFGPQSGKDGIENKRIVVCPVRTTQLDKIIDFFSNKLKLQVMLKTPKEHDLQMAYVQALTHFIARALSELVIPETDQKTDAFKALLEIKRLLGGDSFDLFLAIQNDNPYAKQVRLDFLEQLTKLHSNLN